MSTLRLASHSFLFAFLLFGALHSVQAQQYEPINWSNRDASEVAPGYLVALSSVDDKELNGEFRVDFDGILSLPYSVRVDTAGMDLDDLQSALVEEYSQYFQSDPKLALKVAEKKYWVDVRGLVQKAGKYLVSEKSSLDEIISKAGALRSDEGPKAHYVKIEKLGKAATIKLSDYYRGVTDELIPSWQGGEVLFFQSDGLAGTPVSAVGDENLQLLGQVTTPGEYRVRPGTDFLYYLVKAGGPNERADLENIEIIRVNAQKGTRESIVFALDDVNAIPKLQGGDIVMIHPHREERGIINFASIITAITSVALLFLV